ncbi:MAG TPA: hypothetical protein VFT43_13790 [Candidatus Polarisedimenticolia bacterium]|nr:hypothetical protein [Candidatus Polarisedimenticolia bacterium]
MRRLAAGLLLSLGLIVLRADAPSGAGSGDLTLFDAPRGSWVATVRGDAPLAVLEDRDGWRHVRLEGWVPGPSSGGATPAVGGAPAAAPRSADVATPAGGVVRGVLLPTPEARATTAGSGLIVLLLSNLEALDREHAAAGEECRTRIDAERAHVEALQADLLGALNSSDNFREATARSDRLRSQMEAAEKERLDHLTQCRRKAEAIFQRHTVARTISDDAGRFEFLGVQPGRYRVLATEVEGVAPRAWSLECRVEGPGTKVLDPRTDRSPVDPYWGLR